MGAKQKTLRKRIAQSAIQIPYLTSEHANYLIKMKSDTTDFSKLTLSQHFNFGDHRSDPFLVQLSLTDRVVAGADIRGLKQRKDTQKKQVLPLTEEDVTKARACEEMIMFEKHPVPGAIEKVPDMSVVKNLKGYLRG